MSVGRRDFLRLLLLATASGPMAGCAWMRAFFGPRDPVAAAPPCVLPADATTADVIAHLNANTTRITSWRSDRVKISGRGAAETPIRLNATLTIEAPRNLRLRAGTLAGEEVELGSNLEEFWFWSRRAEPRAVIVARHDEESARDRKLPIPFQPDWIMEALGVMLIDGAEVTRESGSPGTHTIHLIADRISPQGLPVRKVIVVDLCRGVVCEHRLQDANTGHIIASATLSGYIADTKTHAMLPTRIDLHWPKANIGLLMSMEQIEVNPKNIPETVWKRQPKEGYQVLEINQ